MTYQNQLKVGYVKTVQENYVHRDIFSETYCVKAKQSLVVLNVIIVNH